MESAKAKAFDNAQAQKAMADEKAAQMHKGKKEEEMLIRILSTDIPGSKSVFSGLRKIKGISWSISNAMCHILKLDKKKKIKDLTEAEIKKITEFIRSPDKSKLPVFILNRRKDFETGSFSHLTGTDLDLKKEFDIKRLRKIRSYKGWRHATGQPVRGQRTRAHFRKNKTAGVKKKK